MMKRSGLAFLAVCMLAVCAAPTLAQQGGPPKVLRIFREEVKPGKGAAHEKTEAGWPAAFRKVKFETHYLAMTSLTGPSEAWFLEGHDSLASVARADEAAEKNRALRTELAQLSARDGELLSAWRTLVATYRDDLSYNVGAVNVGTMRYMYTTTIRVRPGHTAEFEEAIKTARAGHEQGRVPESWAVFQVSYGMLGPTFLIFQPLKSLAEVDNFPETHRGFQQALGDEGRKKMTQLESSGTLSRETNIFAFSPKMSYVSKETAAADPDFWTPKPKPAVAAAAKETKKPAAKP